MAGPQVLGVGEAARGEEDRRVPEAGEPVAELMGAPREHPEDEDRIAEVGGDVVGEGPPDGPEVDERQRREEREGERVLRGGGARPRARRDHGGPRTSQSSAQGSAWSRRKLSGRRRIQRRSGFAACSVRTTAT